MIPERLFDDLLNLSSQKIRDIANKNISERLSGNWGRALGGRATSKKYRKTMNDRMEYARKFISTRLVIPPVDDEIWELTGAILGDGCLSKYYASYEKEMVYELLLTGNMTDDLEYYARRIVPLIKSKFKSKANYHFRPDDHVIYLRIKSKKTFDFFRNLGVPVGKKKDKIRITNRIFQSKDSVKSAVLRGLLDTDGHIFARKDEQYKYPHLKISSGSIRFLGDLKKLMKEFGLPAYIHDTDVLIRGGKNLKLWMKKIGTTNPTNINRYNAWLSTGKLLPKRALSSAQSERVVRNDEAAGANPAGSTHSSSICL